MSRRPAAPRISYEKVLRNISTGVQHGVRPTLAGRSVISIGGIFCPTLRIVRPGAADFAVGCENQSFFNDPDPHPQRRRPVSVADCYLLPDPSVSAVFGSQAFVETDLAACRHRRDAHKRSAPRPFVLTTYSAPPTFASSEDSTISLASELLLKNTNRFEAPNIHRAPTDTCRRRETSSHFACSGAYEVLCSTAGCMPSNCCARIARLHRPVVWFFLAGL